VLWCCSNWGAACPNIKAAIKKLDKLLRRVKVRGRVGQWRKGLGMGVCVVGGGSVKDGGWGGWVARWLGMAGGSGVEWGERAR
jgi:hypothetical protein